MESKYKKSVTFKDSSELSEKYEQISKRIENALNPLSLSEIDNEQENREDENTFESLRKSSEALRKDLGILRKSQGPSMRMLRKHQDLVNEMSEYGFRSERQPKKSLTWEDIITDQETLKFLQQYFPDNDKIRTKDFLESLEFEFPELIETQEAREELLNSISVDSEQRFISFNALELFTRKQGLKKSINQVQLQTEEKLRESKQQLNENIYNELVGIKEMLDRKTSELNQREKELKAMQEDLTRKESAMLQEVSAKAEQITSQIEQKAKQEIAKHMKRLKSLEKNLSEMLKVTRSRQQLLEKQKPQTSLETSKLKSRIQSLEKSNSQLKMKLSQVDSSSQQDKNLVSKQAQEIAKLKARNSLLEQSLSKPQKPPSPPESPPKPSPKKPLVQVTPELEVALEALHNFLTCSRLTLPLCTSSSPRSSVSRISLRNTEDNLGELLYPVFNCFVVEVVQLLPFVRKCRKEIHKSVLWGLWDVLIYAWSEPSEGGEVPSHLEFSPVTEVWKKKLAKLKVKGSRRPLYEVFSKKAVHKAVGFYLEKSLTEKDLETGVLASLLLLLVSHSKSQLKEALNYLRRSLVGEHSSLVSELLLQTYRNSILVFLALLDFSDNLSTVSSEILLSLTMDSYKFNQYISGCSFSNSLKGMMDACEKAINRGLRVGTAEDLEENLVVLLQKLSSEETLKPVLRKQGFGELLEQRAKSSQVSNFFQSNLHSILRNLM